MQPFHQTPRIFIIKIKITIRKHWVGKVNQDQAARMTRKSEGESLKSMMRAGKYEEQVEIYDIKGVEEQDIRNFFQNF